jgi:hypothetical protein
MSEQEPNAAAAPKRSTIVRRSTQLGAALLVAALIAGCASADKNDPSGGKTANASMKTKMSTGSESGSSTSAMKMGAEESMSVDGITPVPTQKLASAKWEGMKITAKAMTAVPFVVYNGRTMKEIKPTKSTSFHLMVYLNDEHTGVPIPYATVWAEIRKGTHIYYDNRQWPMLSRYMGPHYGNNVSVPGSGTYQLSLLISPPVSARHIEYKDVWTKPHRVDLSFHWKKP